MVSRAVPSTLNVVHMPRPPAFRMQSSKETPVKNSAHNVIQFASGKELQLIERIATDRDQEALEALYVMFKPRICGFLQRLTRESAVIEEAYNDVMYQIWCKASQFKGQSKVSSWIFTIAYRTCLNLLKKQRKQHELQEQLELAEEPAEDDHVQQLVRSRIVERALSQLAPKQRIVIELNYYMGFSLPEIADITNSRLNTVKARLRYARHKLREVVELMEDHQTASSLERDGEHS